MKLFYSPASPFVRKVLVQARERGIVDRIVCIDSTPSPIKRADAIVEQNPSGKVPTLLLDDGTPLYDSRVIAEYLDSVEGGPKMIPAGEARWKMLVAQSLADEMTDAAVLLRYETFLRPTELRWPDWIAGQKVKIESSVDALEREAQRFGASVDLGTIAVACALGHLDLRFGELGWRNGQPALAAWYEAFSTRPSMVATRPQ